MNKKNSNLFIFVGMGVELVGIMMAMLYIGSLVDKKMNLSGLGVAICSFLGLISWLYHIIFLLRRL